MRRACQFAAAVLACLGLLAPILPAYYHFIHYPSGQGPFTPVYEKFDLTALADKTLYFYVAEDQPALAPTDSYAALIGQIRQALSVWNGVATSDLRVGFGGVANVNLWQPQTPGVEILFGELPPGVLGLAGPTTRRPAANGFVPIVASQVILPNDLTDPARTSASDSFFTTLVHEIGHALGLQHSMTGAAMTVEVTRGTSRAQPLTADDVAGLSTLYPAGNFAASTGSITGVVTDPSGHGLHLISVVAVSPGGAVVSALTGPDGSYRIDGLPPATYILYAHPLPPGSQAGDGPAEAAVGPADIVLPTDFSGVPIPAAGTVETQFFGGVKNPNASTPVVVNAGQATPNANFQLAARGPLDLYDVTTYSFPGNNAPAILPAFLNLTSGSGTLIAIGPGLAQNLGAIQVGVMGQTATLNAGSPEPYSADPDYTELDLNFVFSTSPGLGHLFFNLNGDVYVRPAAMHLVVTPPPLVLSAQAETDPSGNPGLALTGTSFAPDSRVYLDGAPAPVDSFDSKAGVLHVSVPPGTAGRQSVVTVDNSDGQSSVFLQPQSPVTYTYPQAGAPALSLNPSSAAAGQDITIDVQGVNTNFADGQTVLGFGTPDVVTRRIWVLSPTHLIAVASISPAAAQAATTVSVTSGTQLAVLDAGFQVTGPPSPARPGVPVLTYGGLVNAAGAQPRVAPGSIASVYGVNLASTTLAASSLPLPTSLAGTSVTLNGVAAPLLIVTAGQINFQIPFNMPLGPVLLRVNNNGNVSQPMAVQMDAFAPGLFQVRNAAGALVDAGHPAHAGDTLVVYATGLGPVTPQPVSGTASPAANTSAAVTVRIAGAQLTPAYAGLTPGTVGLYQVNVTLPRNLAAGATQISIAVGGVSSNALPVAVAAP